MENLERNLEQVFVDVAMAEEGCVFLSFGDDVNDLAENLECSFVDVAFAEAGEFNETACVPRNH